MNIEKFISKIAIAAIMLCAAVACNNHNHKSKNIYDVKSNKQTDSLTHQETTLLKNGDIIMRQGRGSFSLAISGQLNEKYHISHSGIIKIDGDKVFVIHSLSKLFSDVDGVQQTPLAKWTDDTYENCLIIVRLKNNDNNKIVKKAEYYVARKIPFDNDFDFTDTSKFFCSELLLRILADECDTNLIDLNTDKTQALRFSKLLDTTKFDIIINHQNNELKN